MKHAAPPDVHHLTLAEAILTHRKMQSRFVELDKTIAAGVDRAEGLRNHLVSFGDLDERIAEASALAMKNGDSPELSRAMQSEVQRRDHTSNNLKLVEDGLVRLRAEREQLQRDLVVLASRVHAAAAPIMEAEIDALARHCFELESAAAFERAKLNALGAIKTIPMSRYARTVHSNPSRPPFRNEPAWHAVNDYLAAFMAWRTALETDATASIEKAAAKVAA